MTDAPTILENIKDGIGIITLNRPDKLNAFNEEQHRALKGSFEGLINNNTVRVIVLTGAGRGFCAGQDLGDRDPNQDYDLGETLDTFYNPLIRMMRDCPKPIICAVNGVAAGAGVSLALACDIIIASRDAKFIQAFSKIGLVPDSGATWFLSRAIGEYRAKYLTLTGAPLTAQDAKNYGMVHDVVAPDDLMDATMDLAGQFATGPSVSYQLIKSAIHKSATNILDAQLDLERDYQRQAGKTQDYKEGVNAFMEKRKPNFTGE